MLSYCVLLVASIVQVLGGSQFPPPQQPQRHLSTDSSSSSGAVPVVLGVMSQCPDALYCESVWDGVLDQVGDIVDLQLSFVARINASDPQYGVTCRHGPAECAGNVHEACAQKLYPRDIWWPFVLCSNEHGRFEVGKDAVSKECAVRAGMDWAELDACIRDGSGLSLLKDSVRQTEALGIERSCTVVIKGKPRCVRDDEKWKDCPDGHKVEDFVRMIREEKPI